MKTESGWLTVLQAEHKYGIEDAVLRHWESRGCTANGGKRVQGKRRRGDGVLLLWEADVAEATNANRTFIAARIPEGRIASWEVQKEFPLIAANDLWKWRPANDHWRKKRRGKRVSRHCCPLLCPPRPITVEYYPVRRGARVILGLYYLRAELSEISAARNQGSRHPAAFAIANWEPIVYRGRSYHPLPLIDQAAGGRWKNALRRLFDGEGPAWLIAKWNDAVGEHICKANPPNPRKPSPHKRIAAIESSHALKLVGILRACLPHQPPATGQPATEQPQSEVVRANNSAVFCAPTVPPKYQRFAELIAADPRASQMQIARQIFGENAANAASQFRRYVTKGKICLPTE